MSMAVELVLHILSVYTFLQKKLKKSFKTFKNPHKYDIMFRKISYKFNYLIYYFIIFEFL